MTKGNMMTFRLMDFRNRHDARLLRASIILPILPMLIVAALIAALSLSFGSAAAQAANPCDDLQQVSLSARLNELVQRDAVQTTSIAPGGDCWFRVTLSPLNDSVQVMSGGDASCTVDAVPNTTTTRSAEVHFSLSGNCRGMAVESHIKLPQVAADVSPSVDLASGSAPLSSLQEKRVRSQMSVFDAVPWPIAWHWVKLSWRYDGQSISSSSMETRSGDSWWMGQVWRNRGIIQTLADRHFAYDHIGWHSDGFPATGMPDVDFNTRSTAYGKANGDGWCSGLFENI